MGEAAEFSTTLKAFFDRRRLRVLNLYASHKSGRGAAW